VIRVISLIAVGLVAITWLVSVSINSILHVGHIFAIAPLWLIGLVVASAIALLISDP
jgi:hypothetical protein